MLPQHTDTLPEYQMKGGTYHKLNIEIKPTKITTKETNELRHLTGNKNRKNKQKNTEDEGKTWKCNNCTYPTNSPKDLYSHIARMRRKTTIANAQCPYCAMPLANINKLKTHIRTKTCPLIPQNTTGEQPWADICNKNPKETPDEYRNMSNKQRRGPTQMMMEIFYDRVKPKTENKEGWHCARR